MGREDHLTRQINQLGFVLKKMLEMLIGAKSNDGLSEAVSVVNFKLNEKLDFDLEILDTICDENIIEYLIQKEGFDIANVELFADILIKIDKKKYSNKAFEIYSFVNKTTSTFSLERDSKINNLN